MNNKESAIQRRSKHIRHFYRINKEWSLNLESDMCLILY